MLLDRASRLTACCSVGVVVNRNQTLDLREAKFLQGFQPQVSIEQVPGSRAPCICKDHRCLDESNYPDRAQDLPKLPALANTDPQELVRNVPVL